MARFACPYLGVEVELTDERRAHIARRHRNVPRPLDAYVSTALADPDLIRVRSTARSELLFVRELDKPRNGRSMVVVVVLGEPRTDTDVGRSWIVTAYVDEAEPTMGEVLWER